MLTNEICNQRRLGIVSISAESGNSEQQSGGHAQDIAHEGRFKQHLIRAALRCLFVVCLMLQVRSRRLCALIDQTFCCLDVGRGPKFDFAARTIPLRKFCVEFREPRRGL